MMTLAMAAGVADHVWSRDEVVALRGLERPVAYFRYCRTPMAALPRLGYNRGT
jgi:class 3 adenylate cyclase